MKKITLSELLGKMGNIATHYIKHYRTDFTIYDVQTINETVENFTAARLLWFVRESGTYLLPLDGEKAEAAADFLKTIREHYPKYREYTITFDGGNRWTISKTGGKEAATV